jgi:IS30 family transposase
MNYKHLSASERDDIAFYLMKGYSYRQIGRILNRHYTTIMREYKRYFVHSGERYYAFGAHYHLYLADNIETEKENTYFVECYFEIAK